jgi:hypothetical protein
MTTTSDNHISRRGALALATALAATAATAVIAVGGLHHWQQPTPSGAASATLVQPPVAQTELSDS